MPEDWSQEEVEATVADYFAMFQSELRGEQYNKTQHRRQLSALLNQRSDGAIERKHQNISAILIELGFPYIAGYKPLFNYQSLLHEIVAARLESSNELSALVRAQTLEEATTPTADDILSRLVVAPPDPMNLEAYATSRPQRRMPAGRTDYLELESRNRSLGAEGEEFVLKYEFARLTAASKGGLAQRIEHVSKTRGDGAGFDILSFEESGRERLIEVKTTRYGKETPFYVTRNELNASRDEAQRYFLYRVFEFRDDPRLFLKQGHLDQTFTLAATLYRATTG